MKVRAQPRNHANFSSQTELLTFLARSSKRRSISGLHRHLARCLLACHGSTERYLNWRGKATDHRSLLGAAHSVVVRGSCNVVLPFTHAPSLFTLFPTRSFQNRELGDRQPSEPGDRRPNITQTVAGEIKENQIIQMWLEKIMFLTFWNLQTKRAKQILKERWGRHTRKTQVTSRA